MKISIRTKFNIGILFLFLVIVILSVFSAILMNRLSQKASAILKENHTSVVYARDMSEGLITINQELSNRFLLNRNPDSSLIYKELVLFAESLQLEKSNITEPGEDKLVAGIETGFHEYRDSVEGYLQAPRQVAKILYLQLKCSSLYQQLMLLSQINGKALEQKTDEAKLSAKSSLKQMSILATICFLITLSFTFRFGSYFNERFFQLYNGIKQIVSSNYGQRLYFDGNDEFHEISLAFNEMAEKLEENKQKMTLTSPIDSGKSISDIRELKMLLAKLKNIEEQSLELIERLENKK
jgi:two-component system, NtrC family, sensor histidine kinase KinB